MRKLLRVAVSLLLAMLPLVSTMPARAADDTCTWTGAVSTAWSDGANWTGCDNGAVPENGDVLYFPAIASNKNMNNDMVALSVLEVQVAGDGYTFGGNDFNISGTSSFFATSSVTVNTNITYSAFNVNIGVTDTYTMTVNGVTNFSAVGGEVNIGSTLYTGTVDFYGNITGDAGGQFIAVDNATAVVRGGANTFTANTVGAESGATFECRSTTCFGDSGNDIYMGNGQVDLRVSHTFTNDWQTSAPSAGTSWLAAYANISIAGAGTVNDPIGISQETTASNLQFTGGITLNGSASLFTVDNTASVRVDGAVTGAEAFSIGAGRFRLAGANSYTGTNTVNSGAIVEVTNPNGLGTAAGITNVLSGGSVRFNLSAPGTVPEPMQIAGSGIAGEGALVQLDESVLVSGAITLSADATIGVDTTTASNFEFSGVVDGSGDITLVSSASSVFGDTSIEFSGTSANTYNGDLTVQGVRFFADKTASTTAVTGNLNVTATASKAASATITDNEQVANTSAVVLTKNGTNQATLSLDTSVTETLGRVTGDGEVALGATASLVLTDAGDYTFAGDISKTGNVPAGDSFIVKQGTGTATFTGGVVDYSAGFPVVQVGAGQLKTNSSSYTNIPVIVSSGSVLKGTGSVGAVTVNSGGAVNVGNSPGCMTLASLTIGAGGTFTQEIAGTTACSGYDQTTVTGTADITGSTLSVVLSTNPADGSVFTILTAGSVVGTFNGLANNATLVVDGITFRVNYTASSVTLTKVGGTLSQTGTNASLTTLLSLLVIVTAIAASLRLQRR